MQEQQQIIPGLLLISTNKYKQFVQSLLTQIDKYFLPNHHKKIFIFTDEWMPKLKSNNHILQFIIPPYKYPYVTLYRFSYFTEYSKQLQHCSHLYYLDVDSAIVDEVGEEILVEGLLAVKHPGFYAKNGWGDCNNPKESTSYLPSEKRRYYACGGMMGGRQDWFLNASLILCQNIIKDEQNNVMAEWADETHWNWLLHTWNAPIDYFNPSYMMPEPERLRKSWGISDLKPIILALDKNHSEIRS